MEELLQRIEELEEKIKAMNDYSKMPLELERALIARGFVSSNDKQSIANALIAAGGTSAGIYGASVNGGVTTRGMTFVNGLITN